MYPNHPPYVRRPDAANFAHPYSSPSMQINGPINGQINGRVNGPMSGPPLEIPDIIVEQFYGDQIIQTVNRQNDIIYFCFFCNCNIKDLSKVASHVSNTHHIQVITCLVLSLLIRSIMNSRKRITRNMTKDWTKSLWWNRLTKKMWNISQKTVRLLITIGLNIQLKSI